MRLHPLLASLLWASAVAPAAAAPNNLISNVEVKDEGGSLRVVIRGSQPASFTTFSMVDPPRFVIDVAGASFKGVPRDISVDDGTIQVIKNLAFQVDGGAVARIMLAFRGEVDPPEVAAVGNSLIVTVAKRQDEAAARAGAEARRVPAGHPAPPEFATLPPAPAVAEPSSGAPGSKHADDAGDLVAAESAAPGARSHLRRRRVVSRGGGPLRLQELGFRQLDEASRVFVRLSSAPRFRIVQAGEKTIRVELPNTRVVRPNDGRYLDTSFFPTAVAMVVPRREGSSTVLEITLKEKVQYQQRVDGDTLAIDFDRPGAAPRAPAALEQESSAAPGE